MIYACSRCFDVYTHRCFDECFYCDDGRRTMNDDDTFFL
nr:hypothetical protein [Spodoptera exigua multiple nucleopolyhedrovirus]